MLQAAKEIWTDSDIVAIVNVTLSDPRTKI